MKKILFIVNNKSGTAPEKQLSEYAGKVLDPKKFSFKISYTKFEKHATNLAREAALWNMDIVVAVGGDGTVNEVAKGILGTDTLLGIIPKGSGNGLARALDIPRNIRKSLTIINQMKVRKIDTGWANGHLFLSNAGVGFDAFIARRFAKNKGRGIINYTRLVVGSFGEFEPRNYELEVDGNLHQERAFFISVANSNQLGYDFKIAPGARLDDALLDIIVMKPLQFRDLAPVSFLTLTGKLQNSKFVKHFRGSRIRITCSDTMKWMQVDGDACDIGEKQELKVEIHPQSIQVIVP
ncbi:MAG: diacylglycerol/lipid kinase family protein [Chitinophagaceae bacterium]